jgi:hypothetical protein
MTARKPEDPDLAALIAEAKAELRADLSTALQHGAKAWAQQSNEALQSVGERLRRLEQRAAPSKKR